MRMFNNGIRYHLISIGNSSLPVEEKLKRFEKFEKFMNTVIKGTPDEPSDWKIRFFPKTLTPKKFNFKHQVCKRLFHHVEIFVESIEFEENWELMKQFWNEFKMASDIWNIGIRCIRRGNEHTCYEDEEEEEELNRGLEDDQEQEQEQEDEEDEEEEDEEMEEENENLVKAPTNTEEDGIFWTLQDLRDNYENPPSASTTPASTTTPASKMISTTNESIERKRQRKWKVCEPDYVVKEDEWLQMQMHLDRAFCAWVIRFGPNAVFNYMHWFGSKHFLYYGRKLKNLALYNQQAFEACQGLDQKFTHRNTQRGGSIGQKKKRTNLMEDLIRRNLRKIGASIVKAKGTPKTKKPAKWKKFKKAK